jgi:plasmid stabilization system protein ParE
MNRKVRFSRLAEKEFAKLLDYLENNWPEEVKTNFISKLDYAIKIISTYPEAFPLSKTRSGLHKYIITPHNAIFYRIKPDRIEIVMIFDNRQNPEKAKVKSKK